MKFSDNSFADDSEKGLLVDEDSPLLVRHLSMEKSPFQLRRMPSNAATAGKRWFISILVTLLCVLGAVAWLKALSSNSTSRVRSIENAQEHRLQVDPSGISLWYRTWGNRQSGIPVLFVHGGPGNAIEDYGYGNSEFFRSQDYFVIEVDQRGTGQSQPSVRDSYHNMEYYADISIDQIAADYEKIREELGIEKWLVFGGSFGSTISLNYGTRYPERCLGLIIRGIYLDTPEEMQAVYARESHIDNPKRLAEFDTLYEYAASRQHGQTLDPNDAEALTRAYEKLIQKGDRKAIWHWHVYENNLMEEDPNNLLDPNTIDKEVFPEAQSVAFFETRLWLRGGYEAPANILSRIDKLTQFNTWICQGRHDEVCPAKYARKLADGLDNAGAYFSVRYVNSGHEQTDPVMAECLKESLYTFRREYRW